MPEADATDGWFVVNVRDTEWLPSESDEQKPSGADCSSSVGLATRVLRPLYTPLTLR
jgi:hypothetical protein